MKFLSINRQQTATITTLFVVLVLGACYFFFYIPGNEKRLQKQSFRCLQNIDINVHQKVDNSVGLLENILYAFDDSNINEQVLVKSINSFPKTNFTLEYANKSVDSNTSYNYQITENDIERQFSLFSSITDTLKKGANAKRHTLCMRFDFEQFIKPLLPANTFDEYIVLGNDRVVYETFPSGLAVVNKDSLLDVKKGIAASRMRDLEISGVHYKMFLQPVNFAQNKWIVAGLISAGRYQQEINMLPPNIVLFLLTIALAILVLFPWIKLFNMGSQDRITLLDAIRTFCVSILLMSILFLLFFKYNVPYRPDGNSASSSVLAQRISSAFTSEISKAYSTLSEFDSLMKKRESEKPDLAMVNTSIAISKVYHKDTTISSSFLDSVKQIAGKLKLDQVFWMDHTGKEFAEWSTAPFISTRGNYSFRDYFRHINDGTYYTMNGSGKPFYFDQVVSRANNAFRTVISAHSSLIDAGGKGNAVAAMGFTMESLDSTVLPAGYTFAVIDNSGKVLYHSDASKNLNENLLKELSDNSRLLSCLQAQSDDNFWVRYFGKEYKICVQHIAGLPYAVILFEDKSFKDTRDIEVYSFTFAMYFSVFLFYALQLLISFLVAARRSFFKKQLFDTSWTGPKQSFRQQYLDATLFQVLMIVLSCLFFNHASFLEYLFILLYAVMLITIFLNVLYMIKYLDEENCKHVKYKWYVIVTQMVLILLLNIVFCVLQKAVHLGQFGWFELISFVVFAVYIFIMMRRKKEGQEGWKCIDYKNAFTLLIFTRLIISSGLPIVFFYISAYNYEQNLTARYKHYDFAKNMLLKKVDLAKTQCNCSDSQVFLNGVYGDNTWINTCSIIDTSFGKKAKSFSYPVEDSVSIFLLKQFRFYKSTQAINEEKFSQFFAADTSVVYNNILSACCPGAYNISWIKTRTPGKYIQLTSLNQNYRAPRLFDEDGVWFWLMFSISLLLFFLIIRTVTMKIFSLNLPCDLDKWTVFDQELLKNGNTNRRLFVIGAPGSNKLNEIKNSFAIEKPDDNKYTIDMILIPDQPETDATKKEWLLWNTEEQAVLAGNYKIIYIDHFEYNIQDSFTNEIKLNFLELLVIKNPDAKVIIFSAIQPLVIFDSIKESSLEKKNVYGNELERWRILLGHYRIIIMPLIDNLEKEEDTVKRNEQEKSSIHLEARYSNFLHYMLPIAEHIVGDSEPSENKQEPPQSKLKFALNCVFGKKESKAISNTDSIVFKMQITSHYFYMYIWQSLTKEEKFLLYDFAEDGLVNSYDNYNLCLLINKGLIVQQDGMLRLFNKGFRNFILTAIGNTEIMEIKNKIRNNGSWKNLRTPLLVVMVAILTFIFISKQDVYASLIAYVTAIGAGVPAILKLFTLFQKDPGKGGS